MLAQHPSTYYELIKAFNKQRQAHKRQSSIILEKN